MKRLKQLLLIPLCLLGLGAWTCENPGDFDSVTFKVARRLPPVVAGPAFDAALFRGLWEDWRADDNNLDFDFSEITDSTWPPNTNYWVATVDNAYMATKGGCAAGGNPCKKTHVYKTSNGEKVQILVNQSWWGSAATTTFDRRANLHQAIGIAAGLKTFVHLFDKNSVLQSPPSDDTPNLVDHLALTLCTNLGYTINGLVGCTSCQDPNEPVDPNEPACELP